MSAARVGTDAVGARASRGKVGVVARRRASTLEADQTESAVDVARARGAELGGRDRRARAGDAGRAIEAGALDTGRTERRSGRAPVDRARGRRLCARHGGAARLEWEDVDRGKHRLTRPRDERRSEDGRSVAFPSSVLFSARRYPRVDGIDADRDIRQSALARASGVELLLHRGRRELATTRDVDRWLVHADAAARERLAVVLGDRRSDRGVGQRRGGRSGRSTRAGRLLTRRVRRAARGARRARRSRRARHAVDATTARSHRAERPEPDTHEARSAREDEARASSFPGRRGRAPVHASFALRNAFSLMSVFTSRVKLGTWYSSDQAATSWTNDVRAEASVMMSSTVRPRAAPLRRPFT